MLDWNLEWSGCLLSIRYMTESSLKPSSFCFFINKMGVIVILAMSQERIIVPTSKGPWED